MKISIVGKIISILIYICKHLDFSQNFRKLSIFFQNFRKISILVKIFE